MEIKYDGESGTMYLQYSKNKIVNTKIVDDLVMDLDKNNNIVGIEIVWVDDLLKEIGFKIEKI